MKPKVLVTREGEAEMSRMHLTCMRAGERRNTEGAAGVSGWHHRVARDGR